MKKVLIILLTIALFVGAFFWIIFPSIKPIKIKLNRSNFDKAETSLYNNLKSKGLDVISLKESRIIYSTDLLFSYGTLNINNTTVYIDFDKRELTYNKPQPHENNNVYEVYELDNYYLLIIKDNSGSFLFKIYNSGFNEVFADLCEGDMVFTKGFIYYSTFETLNNKKEIHRLNLETMHSSFDFYINYLAQ